MAVYLVTADFRPPGRNYERFYARLRAWGAIRALESVWFIEAPDPAASLKDDLGKFVDAKDGLIVVEITAKAELAVQSLRPDAAAWLKQTHP